MDSREKIGGWANWPTLWAQRFGFKSVDDLCEIIPDLQHWIPFGAGKSYGDAALAQRIVPTEQYNRILDVDLANGWLHCQSGTTLNQILNLVVPKGYFLPVVPGTKEVTVGGAIASDVHGKNQKTCGTMVEHVDSFTLATSDGLIHRCSKDENSELFYYSFGGMGLTGMILEVKLKIQKVETSYFNTRHVVFQGIDEVLQRMRRDSEYTHQVAWIDTTCHPNECITILKLGKIAKQDELNPKQKKQRFKTHTPKPGMQWMPILARYPIINSKTIPIFNRIYAQIQRSRRERIVHYDPFLFPLDRWNKWNRIYGARGFYQFQVVLGFEQSQAGLHAILNLLYEKRTPSALAVLKVFEFENTISPLSFPKPGFCLALDFAANAQTRQLMNHLHWITQAYGGRIYLAKDSCMSREVFESGYPRLGEWKSFIKHHDPSRRISSVMADRLGLLEW